MINTWNFLVDNFSITAKEKEKIKIKSYFEFPMGYPNKKQINELLANIINEISIDKILTIIYFKYSSSDPDKILCQHIEISVDSFSSIEDLWLELAGSYMLVVPGKYVLNKSKQFEDEEEIIGRLLIEVGRLALKTPDGYEFFYLIFN